MSGLMRPGWPYSPATTAGDKRFEECERNHMRQRFGDAVDNPHPPESIRYPLLVGWLGPSVNGLETRHWCIAEDLDAIHAAHDLVQTTACGDVYAFVEIRRGGLPTCQDCIDLYLECLRERDGERLLGRQFLASVEALVRAIKGADS